jgi:hypothetical protein
LTSDQKYTTLNEGLYPIYGAMFRTSIFSIGYSYRKPQSLTNHTILFADGIVYNTLQDSAKPVIDSSIFRLNSNDEYNATTHQLGFAWLPSNQFILSADFILHEAKSRSLDLNSTNDLVQTFNYAIGSEITLGAISIRSGVFTNNSQTKNLNPNNVNQPTHIDYQGVSGAIVINQKGFSGDITFIEQNGTGKSQKLSDDIDIQTAVGYSRTVQLGAKYNF